jgi:hypothetical protein
MPPMTMVFCGLGSNILSSEPKARFCSCSLRSVTLGLWWRMRSARRRDEAENVEELLAVEHEEKNEPGENSSDSRRDSGEVVEVEELLEA